jgi:hypothetical protein
MFQELPDHMGHLNGSLKPHTGRSSDGMPLPGSSVLVMLGPGSEGLAEDETTSRDTDPPSISFELGWWAIGWMDLRDEPASLLLTANPTRTVLNAAGYLERKMRWAANQHPAFDQFAADMRHLHAVLERATGRDVPHERVGADCFECGGDLIRVVDPDTGLSSEDVQCRQCRKSYDPARYRLALRATWERDVEVWVPLTEAARLIHRSVETVETWAKRGQVESACRCSDGRKLVKWPDVYARDREAKLRAAQAAEAKAKRERLREAS